MKVTLSFDNGPVDLVTHQVLDVLQEHGVLASFFVVGAQLHDAANRKAAARAVDEGHLLGNHTMTHTVQLGDRPDAETAAHEIGGAERAIGTLANPGRMFRPYGGGGVLSNRILSTAALDYLRENRYTCVLWNSVPRDWEDPQDWVERGLADASRRDWSLVVLHDLPTGAMRHLPRFIDELRAAGADIVQELPPDCVPIRDGSVIQNLDHLTAESEHRA